ncbi:MAG: hypothetical protein IT195_12540 [Microthrixaceae bacterium]|nr:hypothetical protein [Microthrixaceae bacterium]
MTTKSDQHWAVAADLFMRVLRAAVGDTVGNVRGMLQEHPRDEVESAFIALVGLHLGSVASVGAEVFGSMSKYLDWLESGPGSSLKQLRTGVIGMSDLIEKTTPPPT